MNQKKHNNKGFSLVELIIVIAIMAVLVAVLAPQYIKYVENSRVAKDENAVAEAIHATQVALADETVYTNLAVPTITSPATEAVANTVTITDATAISSTCTGLAAEVQSAVGNSIDFTSKTHSAASSDTYTINIMYTSDGNYYVQEYSVSNWG